MDFYKIETKRNNRGNVEIFPDFIVCRSKDLMVRGHSFYAVYDEESGFWSTSPYDLVKIIDNDLRQYAENYNNNFGEVTVRYIKNFSSRTWKEFNDYINRLPDNFVQLDCKPTFLGDKPEKKDYVSKQLPYVLSDSEPVCWNELVSSLYEEDEKRKIEWVIGAIASGESIKIQKFAVFFGAPSTGKSTIINIIEKLFDGYWSPFDSKELASAQNNTFALEAFKDNPLVGIEHDGDLSRITDNSKLNSVVSHENMLVNEKHKAKYNFHFNTFLIMASNKPVKITDAKAGTIRRLIDIYPKGKPLPEEKYWELYDGIDYELGSIANHCLKVYRSLGKSYYNGYKPLEMQNRTDAFFNFVKFHFELFNSLEFVSLKQAYGLYKKYNDDYCGGKLPTIMFEFRDDLKDYFDQYDEDFFYIDDKGKRQHLSSVYSKFKGEKIFKKFKAKSEVKKSDWLEFKEQHSLLDDICADRPAQYSSSKGTPTKPWKDVSTTLKDLDTKKEHYLQVPENLIVIDFDIKGEDGEKNFDLNLAEAIKWPKTYAELSKSGKGIHLHYYYDGDPALLSRDYADNIEVKVFTGNSALRRKITQCNDIPIATISSGLALKKKSGKKMDEKILKDERHLRSCIVKALKRQVWEHTKPSIDYINMVLEQAYDSGIPYNIENMRSDILSFALQSTNQREYCLNVVHNMHFKSEEDAPPDLSFNDEHPIAFFDIEVWPNLFLFCYKIYGDNKHYRLFNPSPDELAKIIFGGKKKRWVGFNCRRYDNHIDYARMLGYNNKMLFDVSQKIINEKDDRSCFFPEAYNLSWADCYDYADVKQSLKKWEIALERAKEMLELGKSSSEISECVGINIPSEEFLKKLKIHHQEMDWPWDEPIPEELWEKAAEYCCNDVDATEAVFEATESDLAVRKILAELSGLNVNDPARLHVTKIIFGDDKKPELEYTDLSKTFPGYKFEMGHSSYMGEDPGEGGYVFAVPGMYTDVPVLDIESMHPSSIIVLHLFGKYTVEYEKIKNLRINIKHGNFDEARTMFDGKLAKYLDNPEMAKTLAKALKLVINSVYGYTTAKFANPFRDPRNIDNIVAKRGALFMINLKHEVEKRGFTVAHIKTDSIKIPNATEEIRQFVYDHGAKYGYKFAVEEEFEKLCLVNDAVFVGKEKNGTWITTGAQFQVPYVKKTLFTHEPLIFDDYCVIRAVKTNMYLEFEKNDGSIDRQFIGKVGRFCPMKTKGGKLVCQRGEKYNSVTDSKDYLWMEASKVIELGYQDDIDIGYFEKKAQEAKETIMQYGDFDEFVS